MKIFVLSNGRDEWNKQADVGYDILY